MVILEMVITLAYIGAAVQAYEFSPETKWYLKLLDGLSFPYEWAGLFIARTMPDRSQ